MIAPRAAVPLFLALSVLLAGGVWVYREQKAELRGQAEATLTAIAGLKVDQVAGWRAGQLAAAVELTDDPAFARSVKRWLAQQSSEGAEDLLSRLRARQAHYQYREIVFLDATGVARLSPSGPSVSLHPEWRTALATAVRDRRPCLTDLVAEAEAPAPHLAAIAPLFDPDGSDALGAVILLTDAADVLDPLVRSWPVPSETAEGLLVRRDGDSVLYLNDLRHRPGAALRLKVPLTNREVPAVQAVLGSVGVVRGRDYRGVDVLSVAQAVPDSPWLLVAKIDEVEALAAWHFRSIYIVALLLALSVALVGAAGYAWQRAEASHLRTLGRREGDLRRSEERFRLFFDQAPDAVFVSDPEGRYLEVNPAACQLSGRTREELLQMTIRELVSPEELPRLALKLAQRDGEGGISGEWTFRRKDGSALRADVIAKRLPDGRVQAFVHDITDRTKAQEALQATEERLRLFIEHAPASLAMFDREMRYLSVSRRWLTDYGLGERDLRGLSHYDVFPEIGAEWKAIHRRAQAGEVIRNDGDRFDRMDGSAHWLRWEVRPWREATGDVGGIIVFSEDITERKQTEELVERVSERLALATQAAHLGIWDWDVVNDRLVWDDGMYELYGVRREDFEGAYGAWLGGLHPEDRARCEDESREALRGTSEYKSEFRVVWPNGTVRHLAAQGTVLRDEEGRALRMIGINSDITERKRAEAALIESTRLLRIAGGIAHFGGWRVNLADNRVVWSDEVAAIHEMPSGYSPKLEEGISFYAPEWREKIASVFSACVADGTPYDEEMELITARGRRIWVRTVGTAIRDANGRVAGVEGAFQDITERKRAEDERIESERRYRTLFENMTAGFALYEVVQDDRGVPIDLIIVAGNKRFETTTGLKAADVVGERLTRVLPGIENDAADWIGTFGTVALTGEPRQFEQASERLGSHYSISAYQAGEKQCAVTFLDITERKQAEKAVRESALKYASLFETTLVAILECEIILDEQGRPFDYRILRVNAAHERITGLKDSEVVGRTAREILPGYENSEFDWIGLYGRVALTLQPVELDSYHEAMDRWYSVYAYSSGKGKFITMFRDVTEARRVQEALREREYLLSASQRAAHVGTWSWMVGDAKVYWSDETYRLYGLSPDMGPPDFEFFFEIVHPEDRLKMREWGPAVVAGLHPPAVEFRVLLPDGSVRVIRTEGDVIETVEGVASRIAGTAYDVTERKRAEEELKAGEERYRTLFEHAPVGIVIADSVGHYTDVNAAMCRMIGYTRDELLALHASDIVVPEEIPHVDPAFATVAAQIAYHREWHFRRKDGSVFTAETSATQMPDGRPMWIVRDITDRKEAERRIGQLQAELEQRVIERTAQLEEANKELESFSYSVSHDLRAPLRAVDGYARILEEGHQARLDDEGKRVLHVVRSEAQRMGRLIDDLLTFSRLGRRQVEKRECDVAKLTREVFDDLRRVEPRRRVDLRLATLPTASADPALLRQVLANLLGNALKFTRGRERAGVSVNGCIEGVDAVYSVADNGVGFDMRHVNKLFGVFQRLHSEEEFEGTGVGLALVQRILHRHGGRVWAEGRIGQGATFHFSLPLRKEKDT